MEPREIVDALILFVVASGFLWAGVRIYQDIKNPPYTPPTAPSATKSSETDTTDTE